MKLSVSSARQLTIAAVLAVLVATTFATDASADNRRGRDRKWRARHAPKRHVEVICPAPRVVYRPAPRYYHPAPRRVYWASRPYYEDIRLGVFLPRFWLGVQVGNLPPPGYVFYDPYCHRTFSTLAGFRSHRCGHDHGYVLDIVAADDLCWRDGGAYYVDRWDDRGDDDDWDDGWDGTRWSVSANIDLSDRD